VVYLGLKQGGRNWKGMSEQKGKGREGWRAFHLRTQGALSRQLYKVIGSANRLQQVPG
jgi:hypothetical protein